MPLINEKFKLLYKKYLEVSKLANVPLSWIADYEVYDDVLEERTVKL